METCGRYYFELHHFCLFLLKLSYFTGEGEAIYEIGVEDNGKLKGLTQDEIDASMQTLNLMARKIGASVSILREKVVGNFGLGKKRKAIEVLVRKISDDKQTAEIRIVVLGNVEAGKSSLLGNQ